MSNDKPSFEELRDAYIASKRGKGKAKKTFNGYKYSLQRFERFLDEFDLEYTDIDAETDIAPDFDGVIDETIDQEIVTVERSDNNILDYFIMWMLHDEEYAKSTVQTTYNYVQPFIKFLRSEGYVEYDAADETSVTDYVKHGTTAQKEKWGDDYVAVSPEQFEAMYQNAPAPKFRNRLILSILYSCGIRRAEICALQMGDVDLDDRRLEIPPVKTETGRRVWFSEKVKTNLEIWMKAKREAYYNSDSDYLFVTNDSRSNGGISPKRVSKIVRQAADHLEDQEVIETQSGQERAKYTTHSLRHGFAEEFIQSTGESGIYELKEILGHHSVSVTEIYTSGDKDEFLRSQMQRHGPQL
ncbi:tyrosine-type recombinase/integrase [Halosimplex rubrum]|uniref:Tyrosine-type recombinase/integrase n=1 Tax=Halosimplex rubrum TaxID=869889 RepID=A0A7D5T6E6_9EURY|nr:site-specific integrase [Halosimplex rubrum]QLH78173.1 tyrosine-type recombinase/integrase [Halosimplex rubrum]